MSAYKPRETVGQYLDRKMAELYHIREINKNNIDVILRSAESLNLLPKEFWERMGKDEIPRCIVHLSIQMVGRAQPYVVAKEEGVKKYFMETYGVDPSKVGIFTFNTIGWKDRIDKSKHFRPYDIQYARRMVRAYRVICKYLQKHNLPDFMKDFDLDKFLKVYRDDRRKILDSLHN